VAIRVWFKWLAKENHLLYNPASELELPKLEKRLPKAVLTEREAESVLNQTNLDDPMGLRDCAILEVLYSTGIRRQELINLLVQDLDRGTLFVRQGKGRVDRMIPICERAVDR
jgi:integrase/recombinase XerD